MDRKQEAKGWTILSRKRPEIRLGRGWALWLAAVTGFALALLVGCTAQVNNTGDLGPSAGFTGSAGASGGGAGFGGATGGSAGSIFAGAGGAAGGVAGAAAVGGSAGTAAIGGTGGTAGMDVFDGGGPIDGGGAISDAGAGGAGGTIVTAKAPTVPAVTGDCPDFRSGTITYMGVSGIRIEAGAKPAGPTAPMVFYWHGTGSTSGEFAMMASAVSQGVVAEGGVLVSFQGTSGTGNCLISGTNIFCTGDLDIADQLLACAVRDHNVDPHRVYVTGCSAGGLFSGGMAALRSSYVAAAAPNSGGWVMPQAFQTDYTPALMTMHGGASDVVIVNFTDTSRTADEGFKARGGFVINCNHGGGHCGASALAPQVWEFFNAHPYGIDPNPWTALPASFPSYCTIY